MPPSSRATPELEAWVEKRGLGARMDSNCAAVLADSLLGSGTPAEDWVKELDSLAADGPTMLNIFMDAVEKKYQTEPQWSRAAEAAAPPLPAGVIEHGGKRWKVLELQQDGQVALQRRVKIKRADGTAGSKLKQQSVPLTDLAPEQMKVVRKVLAASRHTTSIAEGVPDASQRAEQRRAPKRAKPEKRALALVAQERGTSPAELKRYLKTCGDAECREIVNRMKVLAAQLELPAEAEAEQPAGDEPKTAADPDPKPPWPPVKGSAAEYEDRQLEPPQWVEVTVVKVDHECAPPAYTVKLPGGNERSTEISRLRRVGGEASEPQPAPAPSAEEAVPPELARSAPSPAPAPPPAEAAWPGPLQDEWQALYAKVRDENDWAASLAFLEAHPECANNRTGGPTGWTLLHQAAYWCAPRETLQALRTAGAVGAQKAQSYNQLQEGVEGRTPCQIVVRDEAAQERETWRALYSEIFGVDLEPAAVRADGPAAEAAPAAAPLNAAAAQAAGFKYLVCGDMCLTALSVEEVQMQPRQEGEASLSQLWRLTPEHGHLQCYKSPQHEQQAFFCVDIDGKDTKEGAKIHLWQTYIPSPQFPEPATNQMWVHSGEGCLESKMHGMVLQVKGGPEVAAGSELETSNKTGGQNQVRDARPHPHTPLLCADITYVFGAVQKWQFQNQQGQGGL